MPIRAAHRSAPIVATAFPSCRLHLWGCFWGIMGYEGGDVWRLYQYPIDALGGVLKL